MKTAIEYTDMLFQFISDKIKELVEGDKVQMLYHSNLLPDPVNHLRVYVNRRVFREDQDTLCVDVSDFGKVRYTTEGVLYISFFMPRDVNDGYRKMELIAQNLKQALRTERFGCITLRNIRATPSNIELNCYRYDIVFSYEFDEIQ